MKKTVTVNISGIVFTLDEDAYKKLQKYLNTIGGYFKATPGQDEIMSDIEARIAEVLNAKVKSGQAVITLSDIDEIIDIMGQPEDYIEEEVTINETTYTSSKRKLYRDIDNNVIAGVCAGIGNYFGVDAVWIRIITLILFFFYGVGLLPYIILAIIIPAARTKTQKMEMRGEPINIENISKNVSDKFNEFTGEFSKKETANNINNAFRKFFSFLFQIVRRLLLALKNVIGFALVIFGSLGIVSSIIAIIAGYNLGEITLSDSFQEAYVFQVWNTLVVNPWYNIMFVSGILFAAIVPQIFLFILGRIMIQSSFKPKRSLMLSLVGVWIFGIILVVFSSTSVAKNFKEFSSVQEYVELPNLNDTTFIVLDQFEDYITLDDKGTIKYYNYDSKFNFSRVSLYLYPTSQKQMFYTLDKKSHGYDREQAKLNAKEVKYNADFNQQTLTLSEFISIPDTIGWRDQSVVIKLYIPEGKTIKVAPEISQILMNAPFIQQACFDHHRNNFWIIKDQSFSNPELSKRHFGNEESKVVNNQSDEDLEKLSDEELANEFIKDLQ